MIEVSTLDVGYDKTVLSDVTFSRDGHLSILGPNGSGKSTLARALCGLLDSRGIIRLQGRDMREMTLEERSRNITYIPPKLESYDAYITVASFVLMGRYPYKPLHGEYTEEDFEIVDAILKRIGLEADKAISELSSGQQQLLLIAQAYAQQSRIVIFDEPTANLDPAHAASFYRELRQMQPHCQSVLITHDLTLASRMGGAVLFVNEGTATFYDDAARFFTPENLQKCYGVAFSCDAEQIGVRYG